MRTTQKLLIIVIFISIFWGCKEKKKEKRSFLDIKSKLESTYFCGAEKLTNNDTWFDCGENIKCVGVETRTKEKVRTGEYAVKLTKESPYSMTFFIEDIKQGEYFEVSAWCYGNAKKCKIVASDLSSEKIYITQNRVAKVEDVWKLIRMRFNIPIYEDSKSLKIYLYNQSDTDVYFDDMEIKRYNLRPKSDEEEALFIEYKEKKYNLLRDIKKTALSDFLIDGNNKEWIKAKIKYKDEKSEVKLRFKGDWVDHVSTDKWSFRIKMKENSWKNMRVFSVQSPIVRDFMHEWVLHKLFENEDVLTTRYGFVPVYVNELYKGMYAYEEHFEKQLIESKNRREGPIIKFDEEDMFNKSKYEFKTNQNIKLPIIEASEILPFGESKILADSGLYNQFLIAQNLLNSYKNNLLPAEEIFDLSSVAKFYAIVSLTRSFHALAWHNQRFYYNPVIQKLEIIGYDGGDPEGHSYNWVKPSIFGDFEFLNDLKDVNYDINIYNFNLNLFKNQQFLNLYVKYLEKYSSEEFIAGFINNIENEYKTELSKLNSEYPDYKYDLNKLYANAEKIRLSMDRYKQIITSKDYIQKFEAIKPTDFDKKYDEFYSNLMIKAYQEKLGVDSVKLQVVNYVPRQIYLYGIEKANNQIIKFEKAIPVPMYNEKPQAFEIISKEGEKLLYYSQEKDSIHKIDINKWSVPGKYIPRIDIENNDYINKIATIDKNNSKIILSGNVSVEKNIFIPEGYNVEIEKGARIILSKNAAFISHSPINIKGTEESPVNITSEDGNTNGFIVLQANAKSIINYAIFDNLNTLDYNGWLLTGAVTFYESDVDFNNCVFKNNNSEDALNVIRSTFNMQNCSFENIYSDAFDSDFSKGEVVNSSFNKISNDAIDFSGSLVNIKDCKISEAGDKGISGGEASTMSIENVFISNCNIGIASKDLSKLEVNDVNIEKCSYGFLLLQKKPEYGDAKMNVSNTNIKDNKQDYLIEKGSDFTLNGVKIEGKDDKIADIFYK